MKHLREVGHQVKTIFLHEWVKSWCLKSLDERRKKRKLLFKKTLPTIDGSSRDTTKQHLNHIYFLLERLIQFDQKQSWSFEFWTRGRTKKFLENLTWMLFNFKNSASKVLEKLWTPWTKSWKTTFQEIPFKVSFIKLWKEWNFSNRRKTDWTTSSYHAQSTTCFTMPITKTNENKFSKVLMEWSTVSSLLLKFLK